MTEKPRSVASLKDFSRYLPDHGELRKIIRETYENHRASAITCAAYVERVLEEYISHHFVNRDNKTLKLIFQPEGPLSSFSAKIRIGFAMGLFSEAFRDDLDTIREVRNAFAHSIRHIEFGQSEISTV